ncbi:MAG: hypothetical protein K0S80_1564 [Neobacillus sp.]|nr:hypothetical protein [Neobacillus sp.]
MVQKGHVFLWALLMGNIDFVTLLICAEGARLLQEDGTGGDPADALASRRLPEPPAESEAPGAQINRPIYEALCKNEIRQNTLLIVKISVFLITESDTL